MIRKQVIANNYLLQPVNTNSTYCSLLVSISTSDIGGEGIRVESVLVSCSERGLASAVLIDSAALQAPGRIAPVRVCADG